MVLSVTAQLPLASAVVVPTSVLPSKMLMVALGSLVPTRLGTVSSVACPLLSGPVTVPMLSNACVITGASGAMVSTITVKPGEATLTLPAVSVAVAVQV
ncbi:hypothetical protein D3C78_750580 [compost metagenome]